MKVIEDAINSLYEQFKGTGVEISSGRKLGLAEWEKKVRVYAAFRAKRFWGQGTVVVGTKMSATTERRLYEMAPDPRRRGDCVSAALGEYLNYMGYQTVRFNAQRLGQFAPSTGSDYEEKVKSLLVFPDRTEGYGGGYKETVKRIRGADVILTSSFLLALSTGAKQLHNLTTHLFEICRSLNVTAPDLQGLYETILLVWKQTGADFSGSYPEQSKYTNERHLFRLIELLISAGVQEIPMAPSDFLRGKLPDEKASSAAFAVMRSKQVRYVQALEARRCDDEWNYWITFYSSDYDLKNLPEICPGWASDPNYL